MTTNSSSKKDILQENPGVENIENLDSMQNNVQNNEIKSEIKNENENVEIVIDSKNTGDLETLVKETVEETKETDSKIVKNIKIYWLAYVASFVSFIIILFAVLFTANTDFRYGVYDILDSFASKEAQTKNFKSATRLDPKHSNYPFTDCNVNFKTDNNFLERRAIPETTDSKNQTDGEKGKLFASKREGINPNFGLYTSCFEIEKIISPSREQLKTTPDSESDKIKNSTGFSKNDILAKDNVAYLKILLTTKGSNGEQNCKISTDYSNKKGISLSAQNQKLESEYIQCEGEYVNGQKPVVNRAFFVTKDGKNSLMVLEGGLSTEEENSYLIF